MSRVVPTGRCHKTLRVTRSIACNCPPRRPIARDSGRAKPGLHDDRIGRAMLGIVTKVWLGVRLAPAAPGLKQPRIAHARNLLQNLERREFAEVAARIVSETGLGYAELKEGDRLNGTYRRMLTLSSGRFALIERAHDFSLVPWRRVLERAKGQNVIGIIGGEGILWSIGINRGLGR
jgi:Protein of unknown function (DUF3363)